MAVREQITMPWRHPALDDWSIVGMNHYRQNGDRFLFVSMEKDGRCIKAEGPDTASLWEELIHKAWLTLSEGGRADG